MTGTNKEILRELQAEVATNDQSDRSDQLVGRFGVLDVDAVRRATQKVNDHYFSHPTSLIDGAVGDWT